MTKLYLRMMIIFGTVLLWASACFASGGKVTYPDGTPVVGAEVNVHLQEVDKYKLTTDANGRFTLPTMDFFDAFVQIKAPDGLDYATVNLPAEVFDKSNVSVVLQPMR
ncbi:carboxypeptidase-like regulatory domain-containing protein [Geomonas azotofigens]|uniref:carboxypeptidase-like regulatory domain-containing protein n=1 Tax=Geomonas azotofigens TaxID=2843196 RepID=UPI001C103E7B|nr:carboxypeptidase-like regulatory domain-containing protein [Geomonas azotofigens]MBU5612290.1 carboxypeptidase-like regulatory domain-containing protein [Geomonas azotofigens]